MADEEVRVLPVRRTFDLATIFGITGAFALIAIAIILGGSPSSFLNIQSVLIVLGGTLAVTTICFSISYNFFDRIFTNIFYSTETKENRFIFIFTFY